MIVTIIVAFFAAYNLFHYILYLLSSIRWMQPISAMCSTKFERRQVIEWRLDSMPDASLRVRSRLICQYRDAYVRYNLTR
jgi:hypothetical protein